METEGQRDRPIDTHAREAENAKGANMLKEHEADNAEDCEQLPRSRKKSWNRVSQTQKEPTPH